MLFPMNGGGGGGTLQRIVIGSTNSYSAQTFNVASVLPDIYRELTLDNFAILATNFYDTGAGGAWNTNALFDRYDAENGVLYCNALGNWVGGTAYKFYIGYTVVCYYCESTGGGGTVDPPALVSTTLWTNSSPTSSYGTSTVTLSDDMDNYDFLRFTFRFSTDATSAIQEVIYPVSNFKTTGANSYPCGVADFTSSEGSWNNTRVFYYVSDTQIAFSYDYPWNGSSSAGAYSTYCIPLKIEGLKKTSIYGEIELLWTNSSPSASFSAQSVNVDISPYSGFIVKSKLHYSQQATTETTDYKYFDKAEIIALSDKDASRCVAMGYYSSTFTVAIRSFTSVSDSAISFSSAWYTMGSSYQNNNDFCIPLEIYGVY